MNESLTTRIRRFYEELRRRRVIRAGALYVVVVWPVVQIADILSPALNLPETLMRYLLIAFVAGLPAALVLAWLFDITASGIRRTVQPLPDDAEGTALGRGFERVIIGVLLAVIIVLALMQLSPPEPALPMQPPRVKAIAVLPFVSFSEDRNDQFFSDGLTEEVLNTLSTVPGLRVTARTSSFAYKGVNKNVRDIGRELKVDAILEGSVRHNDVDDTVRITTQLIDVATGSHVWSESFDRPFHDLLRIQDEIASVVARQMQVSVAGPADRTPHVSGEAMIAYGMGQAELARRTRQGLTDAVRYFDRALAAEPDYVEALAGRANALALMAGSADAPHDVLEQAQASIDRALALDDGSAEVWAVQGLIYMQAQDTAAARSALSRALAINANHAMANMWYGNLMTDFEARQRYHDRAFALDPKSPAAGYNVARNHLEAGQLGAAMDVFGQIVDADPHYPGAYELVGEINEQRGRLDEALRQYQHAYDLDPSVRVATRIASLYVDVGDFDRADEWLAAAETDTPAQLAGDVRWVRIGSLVARGQRDRAEALLAPMMDAAGTPGQLLTATQAAYYLGDYDAAITAYERARDALGSTDASGDNDDLPEAMVAAAFAYSVKGREDDARRVLDELDLRLDVLLEQRGGDPALWYTRARELAMRGQPNRALIQLQRAIDEGWRQHWRPYAEPCLQDLLEQPRLQSMMAGLEARMELMRETLAFADGFSERG